MIYGFVGELGSGKTYCSIELVKKLKYDGISTYVIAWADPLKQVLQSAFGLYKSGAQCEDNLWEMAACDHYEDEPDYVKQNLRYHLFKLFEEFENHDDHANAIAPRVQKYAELWKEMGLELTGFVRTCWDKSSTPEEYKYAYRRIIQMVGTEFGRALSENLWIDVVMHRARAVLGRGLAQAVVIDDTRFPNEFEAIQTCAGGYVMYGVEAPLSIRAERTGMTEAELEEFSKHGSERFVPELIERARSINPENIVRNF